MKCLIPTLRDRRLFFIGKLLIKPILLSAVILPGLTGSSYSQTPASVTNQTIIPGSSATASPYGNSSAAPAAVTPRGLSPAVAPSIAPAGAGSLPATIQSPPAYIPAAAPEEKMPQQSEGEASQPSGTTVYPNANQQQKSTPNVAPQGQNQTLKDSFTGRLEQNPITLFDEKQSNGAGLLNDALVASVTKLQEYPIDFQTVLKLIEAQNLPIARDRLNSKVFSNIYYRSLSDLLPDIQGLYTQSRFQGSIQIFGNQLVNVFQTRYVPQLTATWTLYPGGQDVFNALASRQRAKGSKAQLDTTYQAELSNAAVSYYNLLATAVQVENAKLSIQDVQSQLIYNEARMKAGIGVKLDVSRAKGLLAQQELVFFQAENNFAQAQQALLNQLNLDPSIGLIIPNVTAQAHLLVPLTVNTEQLVNRAIQNNPTLKINDAEIRALNYEAKAALSRIIPSVTLQTYIGGTGPGLDKLGLARFGGITVQSNLLDNLGTSIPLDYRAKRLLAQQRMVERKQQVRDVQSQVITAFLNSRTAAKSIITTQEQLVASQEAYRLSLGRFRAGLGIYLDVISAQTLLNTARTQVVQAILGFNQAQVSLLAALGEVSNEHLLNGIEANAFTTKSSPKKP